MDFEVNDNRGLLVCAIFPGCQWQQSLTIVLGR